MLSVPANTIVNLMIAAGDGCSESTMIPVKILSVVDGVQEEVDCHLEFKLDSQAGQKILIVPDDTCADKRTLVDVIPSYLSQNAAATGADDLEFERFSTKPCKDSSVAYTYYPATQPVVKPIGEVTDTFFDIKNDLRIDLIQASGYDSKRYTIQNLHIKHVRVSEEFILHGAGVLGLENIKLELDDLDTCGEYFSISGKVDIIYRDRSGNICQAFDTLYGEYNTITRVIHLNSLRHYITHVQFGGTIVPKEVADESKDKD